MMGDGRLYKRALSHPVYKKPQATRPKPLAHAKPKNRDLLSKKQTENNRKPESQPDLENLTITIENHHMPWCALRS